MSNEITKIAAEMDPNFMFASASIGAVGGESQAARRNALEMCSDLSVHSLNAAKAVGVVLTAGAVGGCMDAASAGAAAMMAVTASILGGGKGRH